MILWILAVWVVLGLIQTLYIESWNHEDSEGSPEYEFFVSKKDYALNSDNIPIYNPFGLFHAFMQYFGYGIYRIQENKISINLSAIYSSYMKHYVHLQPETVQESVIQVIEHETLHSAIKNNIKQDRETAQALRSQRWKNASWLDKASILKHRLSHISPSRMWEEEDAVRAVIRKHHSPDSDRRNDKK